MGSELRRMIRDGTPAGWTGPMVHVAQEIADDARDPSQRDPGEEGWPWSAVPVKGHFDQRGRWRDGLTERTGMSARAISRALADLSAAGYEMREPIGTDSRGRPVFAAKGHALRFRVPPLPPRPVPQSPHESATFDGQSPPSTATIDPQSAPGTAAFEADRPPRTASFDGQRSPSTPQRSPRTASKVAKDGDPIPSGSPQSPLTAETRSWSPADVEGAPPGAGMPREVTHDPPSDRHGGSPMTPEEILKTSGTAPGPDQPVSAAGLAAVAMLAAVDATVTGAEAEAVLRLLAGRGARSPVAVLRAAVRDGAAARLLDKARSGLSQSAGNGHQPRGRRPRWCGQCDERTRFVLDEQGLPSATPCPACRPLTTGVAS
jgi:hypothetical protein